MIMGWFTRRHSASLRPKVPPSHVATTVQRISLAAKGAPTLEVLKECKFWREIARIPFASCQERIYKLIIYCSWKFQLEMLSFFNSNRDLKSSLRRALGRRETLQSANTTFGRIRRGTADRLRSLRRASCLSSHAKLVRRSQRASREAGKKGCRAWSSRYTLRFHSFLVWSRPGRLPTEVHCNLWVFSTSGDFRPAIPESVIPQYVRQKLPKWTFTSNPSRITLFSQEIVIYRADLVAKLMRHAVRMPAGDHQEMAVKTILSQAHLSPLPQRLSPIYWGWDHALPRGWNFKQRLLISLSKIYLLNRALPKIQYFKYSF